MQPQILGHTAEFTLAAVVVFFFNGTGIDETPSVDKHAFESKMVERLSMLDERFQMFGNFVQKEIERGNSLEAMEYYRTIVVPSLVEALRAKYFPIHYDFRMRYVQYELPMETVRRLERLCCVSNMEDLQRKYLEARSWFLETRAEEKEKLIGTT